MNSLLQAHTNQAAHLEKERSILQDQLNNYLKGKRITVLDETFTGQQHGTSWPKLVGKTFVIDHVMVDHGKIFVWFPGPRHYCYMPLTYGVLQ